MNVAEIVQRLADVVGQEKAEAVVARAVRDLRIRREDADSAAVDRLLSKLGEQAGVIGTAARVMRRRAQMDTALAKLDAPATAAPIAAAPAAKGTPYTRLLGMLAPVLGEQRAAELVATAAKRHGFEPAQLCREECMTVLEDLTGEDGLVGTVARFAKARAHLEISS